MNGNKLTSYEICRFCKGLGWVLGTKGRKFRKCDRGRNVVFQLSPTDPLEGAIIIRCHKKNLLIPHNASVLLELALHL